MTRTSTLMVLVGAHPLHLALLQHAQQPHLGRGRHVADLVEEDGAAVRRLEQALLVAGGAGEAALHVAEQLALEQGLGQRRAVHRDERLVLARAAVVDGAGHQLLAGAALALDEHGGAGVADRLHQLEDRAHLGRLADEVLELALDAELLLQDAGAVLQLLALERLGDGEAHLVDVLEGLGQVVVGAGLHRLDRRLHRGEGGHHDHLHVRPGLLDGPEQVHAGQVAASGCPAPPRRRSGPWRRRGPPRRRRWRRPGSPLAGVSR